MHYLHPSPFLPLSTQCTTHYYHIAKGSFAIFSKYRVLLEEEPVHFMGAVVGTPVNINEGANGIEPTPKVDFARSSALTL